SDFVFGAYDATKKTLETSWTDNSDDETRFRVEYSKNGGEWRLSANLAANRTSRVVYGITANSEYSFRVRAENAYGVSDWVEATFVTPAASDVVSDAFADLFAEEDAEDDFWFEFEQALGKRVK
ncbi:MAG: fibronectin type III domain-containing protein, partial [Thermoguttaceae bacterium]|nr:fibronectin type III domain-containing protein [Thermoguttaceae bacterium]